MLIMVKLIEDKELNTLMSLIDASNKIVICAHVNPDGDAIGASLALMHFLSRRSLPDKKKRPLLS